MTHLKWHLGKALTASTLCCMGVLFFLTAGTGGLAAAQELTDTVAVSMEPASSSVILGEHLDVEITVTNVGAGQTPPLVVHLDITDPEQATSVDPEDWTPTLSKSIGALEAGESIYVDWQLQPILGGAFVAYAVVLAPGLDTVSSSNVLRVTVEDQRSLNPGGILPVAIGAPALIGGLLVIQSRVARRNPQIPTSAMGLG